MRIALFIPCFVDQLAPEVGLATATVLERLGHEVEYTPEQTCCGQPAWNAGHAQHAKALARRQLGVLGASDPDAIVAPSGSCVAALHQMLEDDKDVDASLLARTWELSQFLVDELGIRDVGAHGRGRVAFHDACHPLRELGIRDQPRHLLAGVRGLDVVPLAHADECCGFGGMFAVKYPDISVGMGTRKLDSILASGADHVVSTESSCLMQIRGLLERRGSPVGAVHLASVLAGELA